MKDTSEAEFTFKPQDDQTLVTWSMSGKKNFISKAVCMFMNMDKMVGGDFEKGLVNLKAIVEKPTEAASITTDDATTDDAKPESES
jgi:hypothetical protein